MLGPRLNILNEGLVQLNLKLLRVPGIPLHGTFLPNLLLRLEVLGLVLPEPEPKRFPEQRSFLLVDCAVNLQIQGLFRLFLSLFEARLEVFSDPVGSAHPLLHCLSRVVVVALKAEFAFAAHLAVHLGIEVFRPGGWCLFLERDYLCREEFASLVASALPFSCLLFLVIFLKSFLFADFAGSVDCCPVHLGLGQRLCEHRQLPTAKFDTGLVLPIIQVRLLLVWIFGKLAERVRVVVTVLGSSAWPN